jgi:lipoyl(octanoyl) transferase
VLLDLRRAGLGVRGLVSLLEKAVIAMLAANGIEADARQDAPGVYVKEAKIASIGLRVRHGCSFHGLSINIAMDLTPFDRINPCGYPGLRITQLSEFVAGAGLLPKVQQELSQHLAQGLGYTLELKSKQTPETVIL